MTRTAAIEVLLVEDNELDARNLTRQLTGYRDADFTITRVADLAAATDLLASDRTTSTDTSTADTDADPAHDRRFDCILLDLSLPDSEGIVSVEVLASVAPDCPIVVLTGLDDPSTALEAVEHGAQDYLSKQSADAEVVARSIRYAVARHHSEQALRSATDQLNVLHDRERIARDLHDTVIQQLFATGIGLQSAAANVEDRELNGKLLGAVEGIDAAIRQLREAIFGLHAVPRSLAFSEALDELAQEKAESLGFDPLVHIGPMPEDLQTEVTHHAIQVVGEALSNVAKHAAATAVMIEATIDRDQAGVDTRRWLMVTVTDNGRGAGQPADRPEPNSLGGHGLANMADRADGLGGRFHVGPGSGGGTRIEWAVPI